MEQLATAAAMIQISQLHIAVLDRVPQAAWWSGLCSLQQLTIQCAGMSVESITVAVQQCPFLRRCELIWEDEAVMDQQEDHGVLALALESLQLLKVQSEWLRTLVLEGCGALTDLQLPGGLPVTRLRIIVSLGTVPLSSI